MTLRVVPTPLLCRWLSRTAGVDIFAPTLIDRQLAQCRIAIEAIADAMRCSIDPVYHFASHFSRAFARSLSNP